MRERRAAECVELRKAQRVESILKRRNISSQPDEEPLSPEYTTDNQEVVALLFMTMSSFFFLLYWLTLGVALTTFCSLDHFSNNSGNCCQC